MQLATVSGEPVKLYIQVQELGSGSTLHWYVEYGWDLDTDQMVPLNIRCRNDESTRYSSGEHAVSVEEQLVAGNSPFKEEKEAAYPVFKKYVEELQAHP